MQAPRRTLCKLPKAIFVDLSGTLHIEDTPTPGAIDALSRIRLAGIKVLFVTNTTKESRKSLFQRLCRIGFSLEEKEIFTSLVAANTIVEHRNLNPMLLVQSEAQCDFSRRALTPEQADSVVVGLSPADFSYDKMNEAFKILLHKKEAPLIAIHKGRFYATKNGLSLGPGPFVSALEYATGKNAELIGKPSQNFFQQALRFVGAEAVDTVMIGDDLRDDVLGAQKAGMQGVLVRTGKFQSTDEEGKEGVADLFADNFAAAVDHLLMLR